MSSRSGRHLLIEDIIRYEEPKQDPWKKSWNDDDVKFLERYVKQQGWKNIEEQIGSCAAAQLKLPHVSPPTAVVKASAPEFLNSCASIFSVSNDTYNSWETSRGKKYKRGKKDNSNKKDCNALMVGYINFDGTNYKVLQNQACCVSKYEKYTSPALNTSMRGVVLLCPAMHIGDLMKEVGGEIEIMKQIPRSV